MDKTKVIVSSSAPVAHNQTEIVIVEEGQVYPLSIIVWCVGGILLITLLSLLGRIILAKKKHPFDNLDYMRNGNVFRIRIDTQEYAHGSTTLSRDTVDLVPGSDVAITDSPASRRSEVGHQRRVTSHGTTESMRNSAIPFSHSTCHTHISQTVTAQPRVQSTSSSQILTADSSGTRAMMNGYVISPPPYQEVVTSNNRIPSLVVARDHRLVAGGQRRQIFSL